mgnify:CR=1 FL=1|jgi:hypothetical protein
MKRILFGIGIASLKFLTTVAVPAAYLLIKEFVDCVFPSSMREVLREI